MDQRLFSIAGLRPQKLTREDLPALATAMVGAVRHRITIDSHVINDVPCIRFFGPGVNVLVRGDDWIKVVPYLKDNSFDVTIIPVAQQVVLDSTTRFDPAVITVADAALYNRILTVLRTLFTATFPTSNL